MAQNDDVIIVGSLDKKELENSIQDLVDYVGNKTKDMADKFTEGIDRMKLAMKDFAVTQKVSVDLMKEAWRNMSSSFDAMVAAQSAATGSTHSGAQPFVDPNSVAALKERIRDAEKMRDTLKQWSPELERANNDIEKMRNNLNNMLAKGTLKEQMTQARKEIGNANTMSTKDLQSAQSKLTALESIQRKYANTTILSEQQTNRLATAIENCKNKIERLRNAQPKTLRDVLGMDESSVDAIAKKMSALKKVSINTNNANEVNDLGNAYQRLSRKQAELLGKNIQLTHSNNYLAQSFGYIRNRIVYALTLGAVMNFTKEIYEVRGQYELLERSLGILIDNMRRGSEIFNELNAMALKSPFTLMELATGAKQLMAYNFAEDEVVDTTRRLADISSALGVPMERLVYNLGQIRAQTVLTARDARDFANAGLAIVPMLADLYTKQKKFGDEIVTTSQVYDMMSNKMVSYADVMKVINSITDEGGKFFDFQAKQAETMKVQMNNLTLAWNNMLNEIGKSNQGLLTAPLKGLKLLFENWQMLEKAIRAAIVALGMYYTRATLVSLINGTLITQGTIRAGYLLAAGWDAAKNALIGLRTVMITNPFGALAVAISTAIGYMTLFNDSVNEMTEYNNRFGESGGSVVRDVEALYGSIESLDKESATYKKVVAELNQILGDFNLAQIEEKSNIDEILKSREKNIQLIKEEILERKHLNDLQQGRDTYDDEVKKARESLRSNLSNAITENFFGIGTINKEIAKNAPALTNIISDIIESNIDLVANKTGDEYEKGVEKIFEKIQERLKNNKALGLSEETINSSWLENNFFRFYKSNIITNVINDLKDAKEANDQYNASVNENYEAEKRAAEQGATFNDRVEQTSDSLLKAANDTDKFYGKINQLIKDYSGQNIIDFLVRVNAQVPSWMAKMNGTELARLSARFAALASQAKKAGKEGLNVNGTYFTTQQLYERAAQYASAVKQKQADAEARKSTTITKEASQALKDYKQSLEAVRVAKNRLKQGTADQTLVTEKEAEAQKKYNAALQKGVSLEDLKKAKDGKQRKTQKDPLGDALQKEIQLINDIQRTYKEYRKAGVDAETAKTAAANEYTKSLQTQNAQLKRYNIKGLTGEQLATMDLREIRDYYQSLLDIASKLNNVKGVEALEKALRGINVEIKKLDYKMITDGLNSELGKLKDEYELAVELDANPELGNMFADMFNINASDFPKTIDEYMSRAQQEFDNARKKLNLAAPLNIFKADDKKWEEWGTQVGLVVDVLDENGNVIGKNTEALDKLTPKFKEAQGVAKKWAQDTIKATQDLEYELGDINKKIEIENTKLKNLEKQAANETNAKQKALLNLQIQKQKEAIEKLKMESIKLLPFYEDLFGDMYNVSVGKLKDIANAAKEVMSPRQGDSGVGYTQRTDNKGNVVYDIFAKDKQGNIKKTTVSLEEYIKINKQIDSVQQKIAESSPWEKIKDSFSKKEGGGLKNFASGMEAIGGELQKVANITKEIGGFAEALGADENTVEIINDIATSIGGVATAAQGIGQIASGDYLGGAASVLSGAFSAISSWFDNADKKILQQIEESERAVKRLELAYIDLEHAVNEAYGMATIGANMAAKANKELQLVELKRQLALERSRDSKNRDEDKIIDLQKQIKELEYDIADTVDSIVNDLLGISSVGDAMENVMDAFIEALRSGEDAMATFDENVDEMIANMVKKMYVTKILQPWFEEQWNKIQEQINQRAGDIPDKLAEIQSKTSVAKNADTTDNNSLVEALRALGMSDEQIDRLNWYNEFGQYDMGLGRNARLKAAYDKMLKEAEQKEIEIQKELTNATMPTTDDIRQYAELLRSGQPIMEENMQEVANFLRELGLIKDTASDKSLSALQQGIQGITEDTAGALEAITNGISQQSYLQSDLLTQIRDAVVGFDMDVQLGVFSQMLLQLQNNYIVMQSIQSMMEGWTTPSGQGIRVELLS